MEPNTPDYTQGTSYWKYLFYDVDPYQMGNETLSYFRSLIMLGIPLLSILFVAIGGPMALFLLISPATYMIATFVEWRRRRKGVL